MSFASGHTAPKSKTGTFSDSLMDEPKKKGWIAISMKDYWDRLFAGDVPMPAK